MDVEKGPDAISNEAEPSGINIDIIAVGKVARDVSIVRAMISYNPCRRGYGSRAGSVFAVVTNSRHWKDQPIAKEEAPRPDDISDFL